MDSTPDDAPLRMAEDQTLLSSERTYAGWLRTALAAVAVGLGFAVLFRDADSAWAAKVLASVFLLLAVGIIVSANRRAMAVRRRLTATFIAGASATSLTLISWASGLAIVGLIALIWLLA